jgi:hypothetical protein
MKALALSLFLAVTGCALVPQDNEDSGPLKVQFVGSAEIAPYFRASVHAWNRACGRVVITEASAGVPVVEVLRLTDEDSDANDVGFYSPAGLRRIEFMRQFNEHRNLVIIEHELGHALGLGHTDFGVMMKQALDEVSPQDCRL